MDFLQAMRDPRHEQYTDYWAWWGGPFDPKGFGINTANMAIRKLRRSRRRQGGFAGRLRLISRMDNPSLSCIRLILANMPTLLAPASPAQSSRRALSDVGQFVRDRAPYRWVSFE
jgi:hypothetical protein